MLTKEQFGALSAQEQRVAVAQDALKERMKGRFKVSSGTWLGTDTDIEWKQEELTTGEVACEGCALGGMMYSLIRLGNAFCSSEATDYISLEQFRDRLSKVFDDEQLECIEVAFECGNGAYSIDRYEIEEGVPVPEWFETAVNYGLRFGDADERFAAILSNVVANGGTFVP